VQKRRNAVSGFLKLPSAENPPLPVAKCIPLVKVPVQAGNKGNEVIGIVITIRPEGIREQFRHEASGTRLD